MKIKVCGKRVLERKLIRKLWKEAKKKVMSPNIRDKKGSDRGGSGPYLTGRRKDFRDKD
jgi:hypothetical protein